MSGPAPESARSSGEPRARSSAELALEASRGGEGAVEELLLRHLAGLRIFVRLKLGRIVRERERESDVVQSTCREVLAQADAFQHGGEAGFRHWLYTTALRKIVDKRDFHTAGKRDLRRVAGGDVADEASRAALAAFGRFASPSAAAITGEELDRIEAAFRELPEDYREVILLSRVVGLSRAEVAAEMGRTEASVKNLLYRGLTHLSRHLDDPPGHG